AYLQPGRYTGGAGAQGSSLRKQVELGPQLATRFERFRGPLIATAIGGGLARARARSSPERVASEADEFLNLLWTAVEGPRSAVMAQLKRQLRTGALAAASPEEVTTILAIWRRTLEAFSSELGDSQHRVTDALETLETAALQAAKLWQDERIDMIVVGASAGRDP